MAIGKNYTVKYHRAAGVPVLDELTIRPFDDSAHAEPHVVNPAAREFFGEQVIVDLPNPADNMLGLDNASLQTILDAAASVASQAARNTPTNIVQPTTLIQAPASQPIVGNTLVAEVGTWVGATSFTYAWSSNAVYVPEQTGPTYVVPIGDVGRAIACVITAHNEFGSTIAESSNSHVGLADVPS